MDSTRPRSAYKRLAALIVLLAGAILLTELSGWWSLIGVWFMISGLAGCLGGDGRVADTDGFLSIGLAMSWLAAWLLVKAVEIFAS